MSLPRVVPTFFLAFLLGASILSIQPATAFPTTPQQDQAIDARFQDPQAPYVPYQVRYETNRFYLDSPPTFENQGGFAQGSPEGSHLTMNAPTATLEAAPGLQAESGEEADKQIALISPGAVCDGLIFCLGTAITTADFPLEPVLDDVQIVGTSATFYAACTTGTDVPIGTDSTSIDVKYYEQHLVDGDWDYFYDNNGNPIAFSAFDAFGVGGGTQIAEYSGSQTIGNPVLGGAGGGNQAGTLIEKGHRMLVHLENAWTGGTGLFPELVCVLHYGTTNFPAQVRTIDNGARVSAFFEDEAGNRMTGLPLGTSVEQQDRRVALRTVQASPWPGAQEQLLSKRVNARLYDLAAQEYLHYVEDFNDAEPRERDIQTIKLYQRVDQAIGESLVVRNFVFSYPPDLKDVQLQPEVYSMSTSSLNAQWETIFPFIAVGGRSIGFGVGPGETRNHEVNPREATEFLYRVYNNGTEFDTVTVSATEPGGGWTARVLGGGLHFLPPGGSALGTVELVPPQTATAGSSRSITLRASSSFADVPDPTEITFTSSLIAAVRHGVELTATSADLQVRPGETKGYQMVVVNRGTVRDSFVILPSVPSNVPGWTIRSQPASLQIPAGGLEAVQVLITAPASAPSGQNFTLGLTAAEVGNGAINDRLDVNINVFAIEGLVLGLIDDTTNRTMREDALEACIDPFDPFCLTGDVIADADYDQTALFRLPVQNVGDRTDSYKVEAFWDKSIPGDVDSGQCDTDATQGFILNLAVDGVPDGWRFNYEDGAGAIGAIGSGVNPSTTNSPRGQRVYNGFSGYYQLNTTENPLVVPARTTQDIYFELGWLSNNLQDPCPENHLTTVPGAGEQTPESDALCDDGQGEVIEIPEVGSLTSPNPSTCDLHSPRAALKVRVTSLNDPTRTMEQRLVAEALPPGSFIGTNRYSASAHNVGIQVAPDELTLKPIEPGNAVSFDVIATNKGNEKDDLKITVSGSEGWTHNLIVTDRISGEGLCGLPTDGGRTVTCPSVGVYDEVHLQVVATPATATRIGDRDSITVTVQSGDVPGIARTLGLTARAAGTIEYAIGTLGATTRQVQPGQSVSFPLFIANDGTGDDTYELSILRGDVNKWKAILSTSTGLFVPAGHEVPAFLTVTAPSDATVGMTDVFRVQIESAGDQSRRTLEFSPQVIPGSTLVVAGKEGQDILIPSRGVEKSINVTSIRTAGAGVSPVVFTVDSASLPRGWTVDRTTATVPANADASGRPTATAQFKVKAPADALGTARGILHVSALAGTLNGATDITLNLASTFGLNLSAEEPTQVIAPGGSALFNMTLKNLGLGQDTVVLTSTALPAGWTLLFNPASSALGPLQALDVEAKLSAPATAKPGDTASILAFATSTLDGTQVSSVALSATVGFHALKVELVSTDVPVAGPQESVSWVFNVTNIGTLPDEVQASSVIDTVGQIANIKRSGGPLQFLLNPGESQQATLVEEFGPNIPSDIVVQTTATFASLLDARPAAQRAAENYTVTGRVLRYQFADVNGDGLREYALDRNQDASDGFEEFSPTKTPGGRLLTHADLERFLRDDVREALSRDVTLSNGTVVRQVVVPLDGDADGKRDLLLDGDADGQPDYYWDPDANRAAPIDFRKDVNGDQVPESFVDVDGDGRIDAVYDLTRAEFTKVVQLDVDGDGQLDYVVDRDGDGTVDQDETVLYTRTGGLLIVQKVDVDGDSRLDQVFDTNGDGNPDYFIPDGSTDSVAITMRDVTGDGVMDWTFDGDNDGRKESYYDPVTGEAHVIDAAGHFADALREYWYIGALFIVVLVLFVALILVTRK